MSVRISIAGSLNCRKGFRFGWRDASVATRLGWAAVREWVRGALNELDVCGRLVAGA